MEEARRTIRRYVHVLGVADVYVMQGVADALKGEQSDG